MSTAFLRNAAEPARTNRANPHQRARRAITRERLIEGAIAVFERQGYANTTTEHILAEAGVSRASFYAHFSGKAAVVDAIAVGFAPAWEPLITDLIAMRDRSLEALEAWCRKMVGLYHDNPGICIILTEAAAIENGLYWRLADQQSGVIDRIAESIPALAHLKTDSLARLRATLTFSQLDHACYFLAVRRLVHEPFPGTDVMAAQLHHFLHSEMRTET